jgi:hypothetical protein
MIKLKRLNWARNVVRMSEKGTTCMILVGKPEGKTPPGRPRSRWSDNIKMELGRAELGAMDWINLVQDRDKWRWNFINSGSVPRS